MRELECPNERPDLKGFFERNIKRMLVSCRDCPNAIATLQQPVARLRASAKVPQPAAEMIPSRKVPQPVAQLREPHLWSVSWAHHVILMDEVLLNCHCNVVNDRLKHATDAPTIDSILCQTPDHFLAEYIFAGIDKPIDISTYDLTRALPARLQSALRTVEGIEADLPADLTLTPKTHRRKS